MRYQEFHIVEGIPPGPRRDLLSETGNANWGRENAGLRPLAAERPLLSRCIRSLLVKGTIRSPGVSLQLSNTSQIAILVHASRTRGCQSMKRLLVLPYLLSFIIIMGRHGEPCSDRVDKQVFSFDLRLHARVGALLRLSIVDCWCDGSVVWYTLVLFWFDGQSPQQLTIAH